MNPNYYVITPLPDGTAQPLKLEPQGLPAARKSIKWARSGGFDDPFTAALWDRGARCFVDPSNGRRWPLMAGRGAFTTEAYNGFKRSLMGWRFCSEKRYDEMLYALPPAWRGQGAFLAGEPVDHTRTGVALYRGFAFMDGRHFERSEIISIDGFRDEIDWLAPALADQMTQVAPGCYTERDGGDWYALLPSGVGSRLGEDFASRDDARRFVIWLATGERPPGWTLSNISELSANVECGQGYLATAWMREIRKHFPDFLPTLPKGGAS